MSKWFLPLAVFGVGGLGLFALSDRGIELLESAANKLRRVPEGFMDWNDAAQSELDKIEAALNRVAEHLGAIQ
jgi:hypothetical protein